MVLLSRQELIEAIGEANAPVTNRLDAIEKRLAQDKLCYSVADIAALLSVSSRSVRGWVLEGKEDMQGRRHFLKAKHLVRRRYVLELADVKRFIDHF
jgi:hypothetical protein